MEFGSTIRRRMLLALPLAAATVGLAAGAQAQDSAVADFYSGKTVTITVGFGAGGGYDHTARIVGQFLGRHIPGNPDVIIQNMPGAGGVKAANWLYRQAPRDGTQLGVVNQAAALNQHIDFSAIKYDASEFNYLGRIQIGYSQTVTWHDSGVANIEDAKEKSVKLAATGAMGTTAVLPRLMNRALGTKFDIISGYKKTRDAWLAMERGEAQATGTSLGALKTQTPEWLSENKVNVIAQLGLERPPELADAPLVQELATNDLDRKTLMLFSQAAAVGKSMMAPPGVPEDRVAALRQAFWDTLHDPELLAVAEKSQTDIDPMSGEDMQQLITDMVKAPAEVTERAKELALP